LILGLFFAGLVGGLAWGLLSARSYEVSTTFVPQTSSSLPSSGLALAASQFGIQLPNMSNDNSWGPPVYAELLESQDLLEPLALDTIMVPELANSRRAVMDLLDIPADIPPAERAQRTVRELRKHVSAVEDKRLSAVVLTVTTNWPTVSLEMTKRLVDAVTRFNQSTRKSQAGAERLMADSLAGEAERELRASEDRLQSFMQANRVTGSPNLRFEEDRLQRQVSLRQAVFTSLVQSREEARIREVRETPVLTVLKSPRKPVTSKPRRAVTKAILLGTTAVLVALLVAFAREGLAAFARSDRPENRKLMRALAEAMPRTFGGFVS
jgi:uncharacterized protein involved in exopolysaccharide biosynthesis